MKDKIVLGKGYEFSTDTKETGLNNNVAVVGCTGSGKTCSIIIPRILNTFDTNLVLTDPKRELVEKFGPLLRSRGYNVIELNLDNPEKSKICFDPFAYIEKSDDVSNLAGTLINLLPNGRVCDMFWTYAAQCLVELLLRYVLQFKRNPTFNDFLKACQSVRMVEDNSSVAKLSIYPVLEDFEKGYPDHPLTASFNSLREVAGKTLSSIMISMRAPIRSVFTDELAHMFDNKPTFDIDHFINNKSVLFITTDGASVGTNAYVNYIYDTLIHKLMSKAKEYPEGILPIPVHLIMDDFACGTKINSFPQLIATFRSKGISSTIVLQDETQLADMYGNAAAKTIINNNDTLVYLGGNDVDTARDISMRLNLPLDDILYMPLNRLAFFRRGSHPVLTDRYPLFEDSEYLKIISHQPKTEMEIVA